MPTPNLSIVKLGGSVITRKAEAERVRAKLLARLAGEFAGTPGPVVVLHGAGSFGHPGAKRFRLSAAPVEGERAAQRARGAAIVSAEVRRLHLAVLRALVSAGVSAWSVPASGLALNRAGKLEQFSAEAFRDALDRGVVPVSFGDVVPDAEWIHSILSADTIAVELAQRLRARRVVFVSDVPGIFDPAQLSERVVVPRVDEELAGRLAEVGRGPDVTRGIRGKAEAMLAIARAGADAGLISGLSDGALSRALRGAIVPGSWAMARPS